MKTMFQKSPNMIFMDNTYKVNLEGYTLNVILVDDENGNGKPVAYTFLRRETKENLTRVMEIFGEYNDLTKINVVMIDKDLTEIAILREKLPAAHLQICSFHVMKYFKSKVSKIDRTTSSERRDLLQLLRSILYSDSEDSYNEKHERLQREFSFFSEYYDNNWHNCRNMWVRCYQKKIMNFGNFMNNKIESHNEKLKQYLSAKMHLPEAVGNLIRAVKDSYARLTFNNFQKTFKTRIDTTSNEDVRNKYASICVQFAFEIIRGELIKVYSIQHEVNKAEDRLTVTSVSDGKACEVGQDLKTCSCIINTNYCLPCRHIFVSRKDADVDLFDETLVHEKWKKKSFCDKISSTESAATKSPSIMRQKKESQQDRMSPIEKYLKALDFLKEMASFLSTCREIEFLEKLDHLKQLKDQWMSNDVVPIRSSTEELNSNASLNDTDDEVFPSMEEKSVEKSSEQTDHMQHESETATEEASENRFEETSIESDNDERPTINIPIVKSRIGRPKGSTKPFWQLSKSRRSLSLKDLKRKRKENNMSNKKHQTDKDTFNRKNKTEKRKEVWSKNVIDVIELDDETSEDIPNVSNDDWIRNDTISLTMDCKLAIEKKREMLDDRVILAAQNILKRQFTEVNGFQPSILSQGDITFQPCRENMVQILFKGSNKCGHWLTISTLNIKPGYVNVYDSSNLELCSDVKNQICAIIRGLVKNN